jgi:hypothetical protein
LSKYDCLNLMLNIGDSWHLMQPRSVKLGDHLNLKGH